MSDKNPYYSIPKALGEPSEIIEIGVPSPDMSEMIALREKLERQILETFSPPARATNTALRLRKGGGFETVELDNDGKVIEPPERCRRCGPVLMCSECMSRVC